MSKQRQCRDCGRQEPDVVFSESDPGQCRECRAWNTQKRNHPLTVKADWLKGYHARVAHRAMLAEIRAEGRKWCSGCKQPRELTEFSQSRATSDGLQTICDECTAEMRQAAKKPYGPVPKPQVKMPHRDRLNPATLKM